MNRTSNKVEKIAIVGLPRSGSTIVTSFINSLDDALIVGEPYRMTGAERPPRMRARPTICHTRYGILNLFPRSDLGIFQQIEYFAQKVGASLYGFKECETPGYDVIDIIENCGSALDHILVTIRDPLKNLGSIKELTGPSDGPPSVRGLGDGSPSNSGFTDRFMKMVDIVDSGMGNPVILDRFIQDPAAEISRATGWQLVGKHEFKQYAGGGDPMAMTAKYIKTADRRAPYRGHIAEAEEAYARLLGL